MKDLKVAVLGAGKIGKYHVREFSNLGSKVVAILGSTKESVETTAKKLEEEFKVKLNPYYHLETLLEREELDIVSICTPPEMHEDQIRKCLEKNLHVMCEKPLVQTYKEAKYLFELAGKRNKLLEVNTQWASIADSLMEWTGDGKLKKFSVYMEPGVKGIDMLRDHLPHANSILIKIAPNGKVIDIRTEIHEDSAKVSFDYLYQDICCKVNYEFKFKSERPRDIVFSLNDKQFKREVTPTYQQSFVSGGKTFPIEDPLKTSIKMFLDTIKHGKAPLIDKNEIMKNILLNEEILKGL